MEKADTENVKEWVKKKIYMLANVVRMQKQNSDGISVLCDFFFYILLLILDS